MVKDSDKCFRASGIPGDWDDSQIIALLSRELPVDDDVNVEIFSLARNPLHQDQQIATLSLSEIPETLSQRGQQTVNIPPSSSENRAPRRKLALDSHFEGFTPLHTAKDDECDMDIIALSGLNGHAFGSFKERGGSHMWLRDALPYDLPNARIFTYGYNTSPDKVSFQNVTDIESTFRKRLRMLRVGSNSTRKPFVIIAHSLGGIIAKAAVVKMAESSFDGDTAAYQSLHGILLFGVPSHGMDIESLIPLMPAREMRDLLSSLDRINSNTLRQLEEDFPKRIRELEGFIAFNFYETRPSPTAQRTKDGKWEMNGPPAVLVTPFSATQGKLKDEPPGHQVFALNNTHSEMIKFSGPNDGDYELTLNCLREIEELITHKTQAWPAHKLSSDEQGCLQSLWFPKQHARENDPKINPAESTCVWIHEHEIYRSWLTTRSGPLWIKGPPGAGKSTLMRFMVKTERKSQRPGEISAAFFVHGRGDEIQKSHLGAYRSLLHQILPFCPGPLASLTKVYKDRKASRGNFGQDRDWTWEEDELREFLFSTVLSESSQRSITIFIDALDEMGEDRAVHLIMSLERLQSNTSPTDSRLKLCFSCRYYPSLSAREGLLIEVEKENARDINTFIETHPELLELDVPDRDMITKLILEKANGVFLWVSLVLDQVMQLQRQGQPINAMVARIKKVPNFLQGVYEDLLFDEDDNRDQTLKLFQWILFSFEPLTLEELRQALAIDGHMTHHALAETTPSTCYYRLKDMEKVVQSLSKGLARLTPHQYPWRENDRCVETTHQSVHDYLLGGGLQRLAPSLSGNAAGLGHFQIACSSIRLLHLVLQRGPLLGSDDASSKGNNTDEDEDSDYAQRLALQTGSRGNLVHTHQLPGSCKYEISADEARESKHLRRFETRGMDDWINKIPLAIYASSQWLVHAMEAERLEVDQSYLLELLPWRNHCGDLPTIFTGYFEHYSSSSILRRINIYRDYPDTAQMTKENIVISWIKMRLSGEYNRHPWNLVHLLSLAGIHSALEKMNRIDSGTYDRMDAWGQTAVWFALVGGHEKTIASAMAALAHHHVCNDKLVISPLFLAVTHKRKDWVQAIISKGADLNHKSSVPRNYGAAEISALYLACLQKDEAMIRQLVAAGADPSLVCRYGFGKVTVLHQIVRNCQTDQWWNALLAFLLESGTVQYLPNVQDSFGASSTLCYAIEQENFTLVQRLLDSGMHQDGLRAGGVVLNDSKALELAAKKGLEEVVRALLGNGTSPNPDFGNMGPLHYAAANSHASVVRLLLDAGALVTASAEPELERLSAVFNRWLGDGDHAIGTSQRFARGNKPLGLGIVTKESDTDWVETLAGRGVQHFSYRGGYKEMLDSIPSSDDRIAPTDAIDPPDGMMNEEDDTEPHPASPSSSDVSMTGTPLEMAVNNGHASVVQAFLDFEDISESSTDSTVKDIKSLPWHWYIQLAVKGNFPDIVQIFLKSGVSPDTLAFGQRSLLHFAAGENYVELVRILLHSGADPVMRDINGTTALQTAIEKNHVDVIGMLLDWRDADSSTLIIRELLTFDDIKLSPSSPVSAMWDKPLWVVEQVLLRTKYDFDIQDEDGYTALFFAVRLNMPDIVDLLLNHGRANPNIQNFLGETPLMVAVTTGFNRILRRLLAYPRTNIAIEDEDGLTALDYARREGNDTSVALLRKRQDDLFMQRRSERATETSERERAWPLQPGFSFGMMGTVRRNPYRTKYQLWL